MSEYYFLTSLLPPLEIGRVPALGFSELKILLEANLTAKDSEHVRHFLRLIDMENLRAFWAHEQFDPRGNVTSEQMEQALLHMEWPGGEEFPLFLQDYLDRYHSNRDRVEHFQELLSQFFHYMIEHERGFIQDFYTFQRDLRLVMIGFRSKKLKRNIAHELQNEEVTDPVVAQILAQKDAKYYEPPFEFKELKPVFDEFGDNPLNLYKALYTYQFNQIVELWGGESFTLERILNYMARLILVEKWLELDVQQGLQVIDTIEKEIS